MSIAKYLNKLHQYSKKIKSETGRGHIYNYLDYASALVFHGCSIRQYYVGGFYKLPSYMRRKTVTYRRWLKIMETFNAHDYIHILDNKVDFLKYFSQFIHRDWIYPREVTYESFSKFVAKNETFIAKPLNEMQGKGICVLRKKDYDTMNDLYKQVSDNDFLCEELIKQRITMFFGNKSVNTIRVFTILDRNNKAHVITTILRAGKGDSIVDNFCAGGVIYPLDVESGIVYDKGIDGDGKVYMIHPGTDICMLGLGMSG